MGDRVNSHFDRIDHYDHYGCNMVVIGANTVKWTRKPKITASGQELWPNQNRINIIAVSFEFLDHN